jgi:hypothetical protein
MHVNRRTVVRTSAWATPAVVVAAGAPAFAATQPTLNFTFVVVTSDLASSPEVDCNDLTITIDNSQSNLALDLVKVETLLNGSIVVNTAPATTIAAGGTSVTTASAQGQSVPAGVGLTWRVTFMDAAGVEQSFTTAPTLTTGTCGSTSSGSHTSTA